MLQNKGLRYTIELSPIQYSDSDKVTEYFDPLNYIINNSPYSSRRIY